MNIEAPLYRLLATPYNFGVKLDINNEKFERSRQNRDIRK